MKQVTERDFRMPEFVDAEAKDYEFRGDGKLVRKDRWERAVGTIRFLVGIDGREYEIDDVVERVRSMASLHDEILQATGDAIWHSMKKNEND